MSVEYHHQFGYLIPSPSYLKYTLHLAQVLFETGEKGAAGQKVHLEFLKSDYPIHTCTGLSGQSDYPIQVWTGLSDLRFRLYNLGLGVKTLPEFFFHPRAQFFSLATACRPRASPATPSVGFARSWANLLLLNSGNHLLQAVPQMDEGNSHTFRSRVIWSPSIFCGVISSRLGLDASYLDSLHTGTLG